MSANRGISRKEGDAQHATYGGNAEYVAGKWHLRTELYRHTEEDEFAVNTFYGEAAYRLTSRWQVGARYDWADMSITEEDVDTDEAPSLLEHREAAFTLNYWLHTDLVIKSSLHFTDGNLFAGPSPSELEDAIEDDELEESTVLFVIGAQFSF